MSKLKSTSPEIKIIFNAGDLIPADMEKERNAMLAASSQIKNVSDAVSNKIAANSVVAMRKHVKAMDSDRLSRTRKLDDAKKLIKEFFDNHNADLQAEIDRLERLGTAYLQIEQKRIADEERKRREQFEAAQRAQFALDEAARLAAESGSKLEQLNAQRKLNAATATVQAIIATPEPELEKAKGQSLRQVLKHRVIDIHRVYKARPDLVKLEISVSAVNAGCNPAFPVDGLELWYDAQSTYTTR